MDINKVGVVGCGLMGSGITQVVAAAGFEVTVREVDTLRLEKGLASIERFLSKSVDKGKIEASRKAEVLSRIHGTTELSGLSSSELVIEAVVENLETKRELFSALEDVVSDETVFASNTSSLSITEMAAQTRRPNRVVGLHFFNPVPIMKVVEIIPTLMTEATLISSVRAFTERLGKTPIVAPDRPGFIVNRLLVPFLLDAIRVLEEGTASREDLDAGMKLGCGHPMGPLELLDFVGLDTTYYIANIMYDEFREKRFAPPSLLKRMVLAGHLGRKSGKGFYDYP